MISFILLNHLVPSCSKFRTTLFCFVMVKFWLLISHFIISHLSINKRIFNNPTTHGYLKETHTYERSPRFRKVNNGQKVSRHRWCSVLNWWFLHGEWIIQIRFFKDRRLPQKKLLTNSISIKKTNPNNSNRQHKHKIMVDAEIRLISLEIRIQNINKIIGCTMGI